MVRTREALRTDGRTNIHEAKTYICLPQGETSYFIKANLQNDEILRTFELLIILMFSLLEDCLTTVKAENISYLQGKLICPDNCNNLKGYFIKYN